jgi:hypothetical protein
MNKSFKFHVIAAFVKKLPGTGTQILPCYRNQIFFASTISMERFDDELKVFPSQGKHMQVVIDQFFQTPLRTAIFHHSIL